MKKDNRGFFLAETIIVLTLVTTVMAFVYPNVAKLYENYKLQVKYYDQPEDIYALKAIYEANKNYIDNQTIEIGKTEKGCKDFGASKTSDLCGVLNRPLGITSINTDIFLTSYMSNITDSTDFNFNRYLKRMKKTTYEPKAYRLIGKFKIDDDGDSSTPEIVRYASIKIDNPNPNGVCN